MPDLRITPELAIPRSDFKWRAVRSSGPGGQNVNKVSTKVEVRFDLPNTTVLTEAARARLRRIATGHLDSDGFIVITSQATRTQRQNLEQALENLASLVRRALVAPRKRLKTKPTSASQVRRLQGKRIQSVKKRTRQRVVED